MKYIFTSFLLAISFYSFAQRLSVMSYNIHIGQNSNNENTLLEIANFIKDSKVDLVGLQEIDSVCNRSGKVDQIKFLAEKTGMHYAYSSHFVFDGGSYGIGILSRKPINSIKQHRIPVIIGDKYETRAFLTANISYGKKTISFSTVHMDYRSQLSRIKQAEEIIKIYSSITNPGVLTGDFNAQPETKEVKIFDDLFIDASTKSGFTYPSINAKSKIDYILLSKNSFEKVKNFPKPNIDLSDHLPVVSVFRIR